METIKITPEQVAKWQQAGYERLEYNERQQCYHIEDCYSKPFERPLSSGWRLIAVAESNLIRAFRKDHPDLRGSFENVQVAFTRFAR